MKNILFPSIFTILLISSAFSQNTPESYLMRIPALPEQACTMTLEEKDAYLNKLMELREELSEVIEKMKDDADKNAQDSEEQVKENYAKEYGLSQEDMKKLKDKNLSEAEKMAIVNKMMKQKQTPANNKKNKETYELAKEQKLLTDKVFASAENLQKKLKELDEKDTIAYRKLQIQIAPFVKELYNEEADMDALMRQINEHERNYCNTLTPDFYLILSDRNKEIRELMPDLKRLEEVNTALNKSAMKMDKEIYAPGLFRLEFIEEYIKLLSQVFKYAHYSGESRIIIPD
jgi:hypothetical protein